MACGRFAFPLNLTFLDDMREVVVFRQGKSRVIVPDGAEWDYFFDSSVIENYELIFIFSLKESVGSFDDHNKSQHEVRI
jgi:virulence-associated protein VagC